MLKPKNPLPAPKRRIMKLPDVLKEIDDGVGFLRKLAEPASQKLRGREDPQD